MKARVIYIENPSNGSHFRTLGGKNSMKPGKAARMGWSEWFFIQKHLYPSSVKGITPPKWIFGPRLVRYAPQRGDYRSEYKPPATIAYAKWAPAGPAAPFKSPFNNFWTGVKFLVYESGTVGGKKVPASAWLFQGTIFDKQYMKAKPPPFAYFYGRPASDKQYYALAKSQGLKVPPYVSMPGAFERGGRETIRRWLWYELHNRHRQIGTGNNPTQNEAARH